ncbi:MAG: 5-dehydro-4-deoxyglucarate dehydratase [Planctomycetota bacterium]|nr:5-dehydro-4-deoxyglucarate dehydratase [Planctomycetota bacterium]MDA1139401.1 5-dehydro-4-deoxyglucarate dehydratase [Planctomycetota bacterium]
MNPQELQQKLTGVFSFPATPFNQDLSLNTEALRENISVVKGTGVSMIAPGCGTGEFASLTFDEFTRVLETTVEEVNGQIPVIAGTGHGVIMGREMAVAAQEIGADGILVLPPYLITPEPEGLAKYVAAIAQAVDIGIILYNRNNAIYSESVVERLLEFENVIGFKDGSGDLDHFSMMRRHFGDRLAWFNGMPTAEMTGPAYFAAGATGYSSAISNFLPEVSLDFYNAYQGGKMEVVWDITDRLVKPICDIRDRKRGYNISFVKAGIEIVGRQAGPVRPPLVDLDEKSRGDLRKIIGFWTDLPE